MKTAILLACLALAGCAAIAQADNYAVLVAGSNSFGNYRHQADVCHAYQIMKANGIPDDNIIVMMYDDIAGDSENPFPGQVFNAPTADGTAGVDVYAGCKKDYTGEDVTPQNFLKVLTGDSSASGPVLKSGSGDKVFINFSDHGGTGLIAFPSDELYADDLIKALQTMSDNKMFSELVFYLEACESGSMFEGKLPANTKIYASTASSADESSWGTYCPPDDKVNGKEVGSCLGDLWSVNWMEDTDKGNLEESLHDQYNTLVTTTDKSHPKEYGDSSFNTERIGNFQGKTSSSTPAFRIEAALQSLIGGDAAPARASSSNVNSRDIGLHTLYYKYLRAETEDRMGLADELIAELQHRQTMDTAFAAIAAAAYGGVRTAMEPVTPVDFECHRAVNTAVQATCGRYSDYSLKYTRAVVNLCENSGHSVEGIVAMVNEACA